MKLKEIWPAIKSSPRKIWLAIKSSPRRLDNYLLFWVKDIRPFLLPKKIAWPDYLNFSEWGIIHLVFKTINTVIYLLLFLTSILLIGFWLGFTFQGFCLLWEGNFNLNGLINKDNFWRFALVVIGILAAPFTIWRLIIAERKVRIDERQAQIASESHVTDLFTRAVDQLGKVNQGEGPNIEIRLGGIYGLEKVARDSPHYHWPIMETLTAYIRQNPMKIWKEAQKEEQAGETISIDIQAALTVIGRRSAERRNEEDKEEEENRRLDLSKTNLEGADLSMAHLEGANLRDAHLERADLQGAHLEGANLRDAHLEGANLHGAHLDRATLRAANLKGANLSMAHLDLANFGRAHLEGADLSMAHLERAILIGAHLEDANLCGTEAASAIRLTQEQIDTAFGDAATTLPNNLTRPKHWSDKKLGYYEAFLAWKKWLKSRHSQSQS